MDSGLSKSTTPEEPAKPPCARVCSPTVTVLMSVYNGGPYLRQSVESVLRQTYRDFEFLIVDDGSTDDSLAILCSFKDPRIRILTQENRGLIASLNRALSEARGQYIARQDADDVSSPNRFLRQVTYLRQHPDINFLGTAVYWMSAEGRPRTREVYPQTPIGCAWETLFRCPIVHASMMARREVMIGLGGYSTAPTALHAEDYDLFSRAVQAGRACANLREPLYAIRRGMETVSSRHAHQQWHNHLTISRQNLRALWQRASDPVPTIATPRNCVSLVELYENRASVLDLGATREDVHLLKAALHQFKRVHRATDQDMRSLARRAAGLVAIGILNQTLREWSGLPLRNRVGLLCQAGALHGGKVALHVIRRAVARIGLPVGIGLCAEWSA